MYNSPQISFVLILAGDLESVVESSFYLSYHAGIQPSEVDRLSTYEFNKYMELLNNQVKSDKEYEMTIAQTYGGLGGFLNRRNI